MRVEDEIIAGWLYWGFFVFFYFFVFFLENVGHENAYSLVKFIVVGLILHLLLLTPTVLFLGWCLKLHAKLLTDCLVAALVRVDKQFHIFDSQIFLLPRCILIHFITILPHPIHRLNTDIRYFEAERELVLLLVWLRIEATDRLLF